MSAVNPKPQQVMPTEKARTGAGKQRQDGHVAQERSSLAAVRVTSSLPGAHAIDDWCAAHLGLGASE